MRIAVGIALVVRGVIPPTGYVVLPAAFALLSIDLPRVRRWRRRLIVWLGRRRKGAKSRRAGAKAGTVERNPT